MNDGDALLAAIIANPDEDTPRLVYADWLDENEQPERAEFIREAVQYPHCEFVRLTSKDPFPLLGIEPLEPVDINPFTEQTNHRPDFRTWMWGETDALGCVVHDLTRGLDYKPDRGFIKAVRCAAANWLTHGAAILAAHPVREVTLTTLTPDMDTGGSLFEQLKSNVNEWVNDRWPGIMFKLPTPAIEFPDYVFVGDSMLPATGWGIEINRDELAISEHESTFHTPLIQGELRLRLSGPPVLTAGNIGHRFGPVTATDRHGAEWRCEVILVEYEYNLDRGVTTYHARSCSALTTIHAGAAG